MSSTFGTNASISGSVFTGIAGDNGAGNINCYSSVSASPIFPDFVPTEFQVVSRSIQSWNLSYDTATTIEGSYLLDGTFFETHHATNTLTSVAILLYVLRGTDHIVWETYHTDLPNPTPQFKTFSFTYDPSLTDSYTIYMDLTTHAYLDIVTPGQSVTQAISDMNFQVNLAATAVPEPTSILLVASGIGGLVGLRKRK